MRFKLTPRSMLLAALCICLMGEDLWLKNSLASNTGRIAFTSSRDGNAEIYVMDANGRNQERLTNHPATDGMPDWSPDGTKIAFVSHRDGNRSQIHVMDADGENVIRLTDLRVGIRRPEWSPDGKKIAFSVEGRDWHIVVMDADENNRVRLEGQAADPSWSPDGGQIAFVSARDGGSEIYVIGVDGQRRKRLTHDLAPKGDPSFSPDGQRIAYVAAELLGLNQLGLGQIYVVGADGRKRERLTHNEENHWGPAWSPDGQMIAYYVIVDGNFHTTIHLMTADGRYIRQLSHGRNARDFAPDISPLGLAVAPTSNKTTTWGKLKKFAPDPHTK